MNRNPEKERESEELAMLVDEYLKAGGKIEVLPYIKPDAFTVKMLGFMRKFERENE